MDAHIRLQDLTKEYQQGGQVRGVLRGVNADFRLGEVAAIRGRSGSGKTTLLNLVAGLDTPTEGRIHIDGLEITGLTDRERTLFRRDNIGIIFQFFNLIPTLNVIENVLLPAELSGSITGPVEERAMKLLERVGLADRAGEFIDRLSGGEQQRVAIARSLVQDPRIVLADEPTGNLDEATGESVIELLNEVTRELGRTLILVTHSHAIASIADRVLSIHEGQLVAETDALPISGQLASS